VLLLPTFCRMAVKLQSQHAKRPPQTANWPPRTGALACTALRDPIIRAPAGANRAPLMECQIPPPMAPMQNAPPTSSTMRHGQGSRSAIPDFPIMDDDAWWCWWCSSEMRFFWRESHKLSVSMQATLSRILKAALRLINNVMLISQG
jgi:hypothetical protein